MPLSNLPLLKTMLWNKQDHRGIKRRVNASQGFRSFDGAWRTIQGYEILHMIRKPSSGKSVGDGEGQRAVAVRNRRNFLQVESKDLC
jgi:hypothetical protein